MLQLCSHLPHHKNFKLFFDNYFTYMELLLKLKQYGFWAVGTLRSDRMRGCNVKTEKVLKKEGRGSFDGAFDRNSGLVIIRWFDNKAVQLASNYIDVDPVSTVQRWSKEARKMIDVPRPNIVAVYNAAMGGVDLFDMFQSLYRMDHKSRRWYMRIFYWILSSSVINGWIKYRKDFDKLNHPSTKPKRKTLIQFTTEVAAGLLKGQIISKKRAGRPSSLSNKTPSKAPRKAPDLKEVPDHVRYDEVGHWPVHREDRPKCFYCKEKTRIGCKKCKKGLCLTKDRNCFLEFHGAELP